MADARPAVSRPLSPHLQIFRPILTMTMSIVHRITGAGLYFGMALLAWWFVAAASGPAAFACASAFFGSWFGQLVLFGFTWALVHHALGGIRHFIWDLGYGFGLEARNFMAKATIVGSVALTLILWIVAFVVA
ncbi:succinate dehydrogenase, cytochrome b556 subunit [Oharaeibacter diazotrophicus]|uniref:Succinate dehydrogenase cytochrome b556 subunit n=1 Tax=Oharaeibacter diazotrophicus TaxID=1920512 RepID=A0A4R6R860_9HYPH|nr:succinate dehydrogenase, cytochrome b556 subunit [Oharaeibacter diazotrophicus]TDP81945.1 succinate dehydrogenase subunit C [Oharaeibacter diazotrophicus]BBE73577.1 succinate dehydrogenase [Pleomorphomonas sp. SM30]GLS75367.1 succinate dehydrogenase membrane anchor subunit [Oharaeibacter diazotrophicus]